MTVSELIALLTRRVSENPEEGNMKVLRPDTNPDSGGSYHEEITEIDMISETTYTPRGYVLECSVVLE